MAVTTLATDLRVEGASTLRGELSLPGDKSISHRALMLALLAAGESRITGAGDGADVRSTARIVQSLGARVTSSPGIAGNVDYVVRSGGRGAIREPMGPLDCGNSGTTMRLFSGILAGVPMRATLDGDSSLRGRPMARVIEPLRAMGADVIGSGDGATRPPLDITGRSALRAIDVAPPVPSAQVKSAILLAGLAAHGTTRVRESTWTRDHTERMLRARGVTVRTTLSDDLDSTGFPSWAQVELEGPATVEPRDERVPGDFSAAAFWLVAASIHPDAELWLRGVGFNPTRREALSSLIGMGTSAEVRGSMDLDGIGEDVADIRVFTPRRFPFTAIEMTPAQTARAIDEIPVLCLAATQAEGRTVIRGAGELRHKESDRIAGIVTGLSRLGARITADGDDIVIDGRTPLQGAVVDSLGDHRLAMTFAIAGLIASGATTIRGADSVAISYPTFFADLERIRA